MSTFDAIYAALDAARTVTQTAESAANHEFDAWQQTVATLKADKAALAAQVADLQAQLAALQPKTRYGINASDSKQKTAADTLFAPVDVWRYYQQPGEPIAYPTEYTLAAGQQFAYSDKVSPQDKAAGKADTALRALFTKMGTGYYCPWHEPEDDIENGHFTLADYHAMWTRVSKIAREYPGIRLAAILMDFTIRGGKGRKPADYLPADYDLIGTDAYVAGSIGIPAANAATLFDPVAALAKTVGKRWGAFEIGVGQKVTGQARLDALKAVSGAARAKGAEVACYFMQGATAEWAVDAAAVGAWKAGRAV